MKFRQLVFWLLLPVILSAQTIVTVKDGDINANDNVTWTSDNEYLLDGLVFVESGATLTIQPGTIIRGKEVPTTGDNTSALIIVRGAQIFAEGTANAPIIFTAENDDVNDPNDLLPTDRGLWGGVIILGNARINTAAGEGQIEGIDPNEVRA
ncbi:MAG: T9SS C-terminal target domain-containing protein, partial [Chloroflexi bacterium]